MTLPGCVPHQFRQISPVRARTNGTGERASQISGVKPRKYAYYRVLRYGGVLMDVWCQEYESTFVSSGNLRSSLLSLIRRHDRLLTLTGALIVFATFIVKETLQEDSRNLADSIQTAESVFVLRSEMMEIHSRLRDLQDWQGNQESDRRVAKITSQLRRLGVKLRPNVPSMLRATDAALRDTSTNILTVQASVNRISDLSEKLPNQAAQFKERLDSLQKSLAGIRAKYDSAVVHPHDDPTYNSPEKMFVVVLNLDSEIDDLHESTNNVANEVLNDARVVRSKTEESYASFKRMSFLLYSIGWGIALASKLISAGAELLA